MTWYAAFYGRAPHLFLEKSAVACAEIIYNIKGEFGQMK